MYCICPILIAHILIGNRILTEYRANIMANSSDATQHMSDQLKAN